MSFLLLSLLIAGIIVGLVLLRRAKRKIKSLKKGTSVERIECTEKSTLTVWQGSQGKEGKPATGNDKEQQINDEWVEQTLVELHVEGTDVLRQGSLNSEDGSRVRYIGDYDEIKAAEVLSKNRDGDDKTEKGLQSDQPIRMYMRCSVHRG